MMTAESLATSGALVVARQPPLQTLLSLPDELFIPILIHLDIPDLLAVSRTSRRLRRLALDTQLHHLRLYVYIPSRLVAYLSLRPTEQDLLSQHILKSPLRLAHRFHAAANGLRLAFARNSLRRKLELRPQLNDLIQRGVYPATDARVSPVLAMRCKALEREKIRNLLEQELKGRIWDRIRNAMGLREKDKQESVRVLVSRYSQRRREDSSAGSAFEKHRRDVREAPTRAKVYRLRLFFERISRSQKVSFAVA
ncbi:hypothetical protein V1517DRAFT_260435 [Lipomyces orientalis]|uniref:Uncharacterized protein n=1 Tax=Lipomyces orientalis TaxID=1233043 RepID=A0ACC3TN55_9ASCO